ncbi:MAG: DUF2961 domain-containing protein, partial [Actinobacteria bacterium]|nr:DUF2961 domain-containing protein [Actinomycetota bacterium]
FRIGCPYIKTISANSLIGGITSGRFTKGSEKINFKDLDIVGKVAFNLEDMNFKDPLSQVSIYRFFSNDPIRFNNSIEWRLNWSHEFDYYKWGKDYKVMLSKMLKEDRLYTDYAYVIYWYQRNIGYLHEKLPDVYYRGLEILKSNF